MSDHKDIPRENARGYAGPKTRVGIARPDGTHWSWDDEKDKHQRAANSHLYPRRKPKGITEAQRMRNQLMRDYGMTASAADMAIKWLREKE
jgi:hypothetical protein